MNQGIDDKVLIEELRSLERQRQDALETLQRIDGATSMVRHLMLRVAKSAQPDRPQEEASAEEVKPEQTEQTGQN